MALRGCRLGLLHPRGAAPLRPDISRSRGRAPRVKPRTVASRCRCPLRLCAHSARPRRRAGAGAASGPLAGQPSFCDAEHDSQRLAAQHITRGRVRPVLLRWLHGPHANRCLFSLICKVTTHQLNLCSSRVLCTSRGALVGCWQTTTEHLLVVTSVCLQKGNALPEVPPTLLRFLLHLCGTGLLPPSSRV